MAQAVKNLPAKEETQEMRIWSLSQEGPLEEAMATLSSILACRISWTDELGRLLSMGSQRIRHDWVHTHTCTHTHAHTHTHTHSQLPSEIECSRL